MEVRENCTKILITYELWVYDIGKITKSRPGIIIHDKKYSRVSSNDKDWSNWFTLDLSKKLLTHPGYRLYLYNYIPIDRCWSCRPYYVIETYWSYCNLYINCYQVQCAFDYVTVNIYKNKLASSTCFSKVTYGPTVPVFPFFNTSDWESKFKVLSIYHKLIRLWFESSQSEDIVVKLLEIREWANFCMFRNPKCNTISFDVYLEV